MSEEKQPLGGRQGEKGHSHTNSATLKKSLFPVQRVAQIVASHAAAKSFLFLGMEICKGQWNSNNL